MSYVKRVLIFSAILILAACQKDRFEPTASEHAHVHDTDHSRCNMELHMSLLLQDPDFARKHQFKYEAVASYNMPRSGCSTPTVLPVAIHFQKVSSPDKTCLTDLAKAQIKILNDDLQGKNGDISTWKSSTSKSFPGISNGEACLELCIADQNHPSGYGLSKGDLAITFNQTSGDRIPDFKGYLNIIVRRGTGVLGYAPLGGSGDGDAVVIDADAFGSGAGCPGVRPQSPYTLGRTTTHEVGHYLFMDHIWGNGCGRDDGIADTPDSDDSYYGCPRVGVKTCGTTDLHMNYMDYTDDNCMYMFTSGQATAMEKYVGSSLQNLVNKAKLVCSGTGGGGGVGTKATDALVSSIKAPKGVLCATSVTPKVVLKNNGPEVLTSVELHYGLDGSLTKVKNWSGSLQVGKSVTVTLSALSVKSGARTFTAETRNPNKEKDLNPGNDDKTSSFTAVSGGNYTLNIKPDDWGGDITWKLFDVAGKVLYKGGPYPDFNRKLKTKSFCLEDGCYTFKIYDSWGDGICCAYGKGWYNLKDANGKVIFSSNGRYGYQQTKKFCLSSGSFNLVSESGDQKQETQDVRVMR